MQIGRWYDPIERKWHEPKPVKSVEILQFEESPYDRGRRENRQRIIWDAVTATAQASQQVDGAG